MNDWFALSGVPAGFRVYEKLLVRGHRFLGLETKEDRQSWKLDSFVDEIVPLYSQHTILLGQDLGGLIAAMACVRKTPKALVLTGTAVNDWWRLTRWSAWPIIHHFFYGAFQGDLFVRLGEGKDMYKKWDRPLEPKILAKRMRKLAKEMRPPKNLSQHLVQSCPIFLIWGKKDRAYPYVLAKYTAEKWNAPLFGIDGGHYCMWNEAREFSFHMRQIETYLL